jgi:hypothetical protein
MKGAETVFKLQLGSIQVHVGAHERIVKLAKPYSPREDGDTRRSYVQIDVAQNSAMQGFIVFGY